MLKDAIAHPRAGNNTGTRGNVPDDPEGAAERTLADVVRLLKAARPDQFERVLDREWTNRLYDLYAAGLLDAPQIARHFLLAADGLQSKIGVLDAFCQKHLPMPRTPDGVKAELGFSYGEYKPGDEPDELIKRLLPRNGVTMIGGQSGAGKTFVLLALAIAGATKGDLLGYPVREAFGTIICAAEGAGTIPARLEAAKRHAGVKGELPIGVLKNIPDLKDPAKLQTFVDDLRIIKAEIEARHRVRVGVVAIDTIASAFSIENENDNSEAAYICKMLAWISQQLDVCVIPVHHFGKSAEQGLRGASAWRANVDHAISVLVEREPETSAVTSRSIGVMKSRIGEEGPASSFMLATLSLGVNRWGEDIETCYIEKTDAPPSKAALKKMPNAKTDRRFSKSFDEAVIAKGVRQRIHGDGPEVRMVGIEIVKKEFLRRHISGDATTKPAAVRMAWKRALERALEGGAYAAETDEKTGLEMIWDTMAELPFGEGGERP